MWSPTSFLTIRPSFKLFTGKLFYDHNLIFKLVITKQHNFCVRFYSSFNSYGLIETPEISSASASFPVKYVNARTLCHSTVHTQQLHNHKYMKVVIKCLFWVLCHFQQYFSHIMPLPWAGLDNQSSLTVPDAKYQMQAIVMISVYLVHYMGRMGGARSSRPCKNIKIRTKNGSIPCKRPGSSTQITMHGIKTILLPESRCRKIPFVKIPIKLPLAINKDI